MKILALISVFFLAVSCCDCTNCPDKSKSDNPYPKRVHLSTGADITIVNDSIIIITDSEGISSSRSRVVNTKYLER